MIKTLSGKLIPVRSAGARATGTSRRGNAPTRTADAPFTPLAGQLISSRDCNEAAPTERPEETRMEDSNNAGKMRQSKATLLTFFHRNVDRLQAWVNCHAAVCKQITAKPL